MAAARFPWAEPSSACNLVAQVVLVGLDGLTIVGRFPDGIMITAVLTSLRTIQRPALVTGLSLRQQGSLGQGFKGTEL